MIDSEIVHTIIWGIFFLVLLIIGILWICPVPKWNKDKEENGNE